MVAETVIRPLVGLLVRRQVDLDAGSVGILEEELLQTGAGAVFRHPSQIIMRCA